MPSRRCFQNANCSRPAWLSSHCCWRTAKSAYCTDNGGKEGALPARNDSYSSASSCKRILIEAASAARRCSVINNTCSLSATRATVARTSKSRLRSNGRRACSKARRSSSFVRSGNGRLDKSVSVRRTGAAAETTGAGCPALAAKVVRSVSCRRIVSLRLCCNAAWLSGPVSRNPAQRWRTCAIRSGSIPERIAPVPRCALARMTLGYVLVCDLASSLCP